MSDVKSAMEKNKAECGKAGRGCQHCLERSPLIRWLCARRPEWYKKVNNAENWGTSALDIGIKQNDWRERIR